MGQTDFQDYDELDAMMASTKQLVSKAKLIMKDRVFRHGTTTSMLGNPESFRIAKSNEEKAKEK